MNDARLGMGGNAPPDMAATATTTTITISAWMDEHPVVDGVTARQAKDMIDRGVLCIQDLEDERKGLIRPLREQQKQIDDHYRESREPLRQAVDELQHRLDRHIADTKREREAAAAAAAARARQAEQDAAAAEQAKRDTLSDAASGVLDTHFADAAARADAAVKASQRLGREAQIAEHDARYIVRGEVGLRRGTSGEHAQTHFIIENVMEFIADVGMPHELEELMIKIGKAFFKHNQRYPKGMKMYTKTKSLSRREA
jgi:uncharacterized membrane-anchored protein YhcB (DUF1043 family)